MRAISLFNQLGNQPMVIPQIYINGRYKRHKVLLLACSVQICLDLVWTLGISTDRQTNIESCSEGGSLPTKHPESLGMAVSLCNTCFPLRHLHLTTT